MSSFEAFGEKKRHKDVLYVAECATQKTGNWESWVVAHFLL